MSSKKSKAAKMSKKAARAEGQQRSDRLRKQVANEIQERIDRMEYVHPAGREPAAHEGDAFGHDGEKITVTIPVDQPQAEPTKPRRVSALDAAAEVLAINQTPMRVGDMITAMEAKGLWKSPGGKTPAATLNAAIIREISAKGDAARFRKVERGLFVRA